MNAAFAKTSEGSSSLSGTTDEKSYSSDGSGGSVPAVVSTVVSGISLTDRLSIVAVSSHAVVLVMGFTVSP